MVYLLVFFGLFYMATEPGYFCDTVQPIMLHLVGSSEACRLAGELDPGTLIITLWQGHDQRRTWWDSESEMRTVFGGRR